MAGRMAGCVPGKYAASVCHVIRRALCQAQLWKYLEQCVLTVTCPCAVLSVSYHMVIEHVPIPVPVPVPVPVQNKNKYKYTDTYVVRYVGPIAMYGVGRAHTAQWSLAGARMRGAAGVSRRVTLSSHDTGDHQLSPGVPCTSGRAGPESAQRCTQYQSCLHETWNL